MVPATKSLRKISLVFLVRCRELEVHKNQESKDHCLEKSDQQFKEVERNGDDATEDRGEPIWEMENLADVYHCREHVLTGKDIPIESEGERDGANQNGNNLQHSHKEKERY
jgi:hypothetical protein